MVKKEQQLSHGTMTQQMTKLLEKRLNNGYTTGLFIFIPALALGCKIAMRKRLFYGRKLTYYEHLAIMTYLYIIEITLSLLFYIIRLPFGYHGLPECPNWLLFAYAVWIYKCVYRWKWHDSLKPMCALLFYQSVMYMVAILIPVMFFYFAAKIYY